MFDFARDRDTIAKGVAIALLLHTCLIPVAVLYSPALIVWGAVQLIYELPVIIHFWNKGERSTAKGMIIVTSIGFLLNSACDALFLLAFSNAYRVH